MSAIRLQHLTIAYDRHPAVHHLDGVFADGSLTAIVGPNGAGKSTLLKCIAGLLPAAEGHVALPGLRPRQLAYLPQQAEIDRSFPVSVADTVMLGAWAQVGAFGSVSRALRARGAQALATVGLEGFGTRPIGSLSVGQFQRVLFARMLLQDAPVILLDEPFAALDQRTTTDLLALVERWHGERRTVIAVLHDLEMVRRHFPQTLLMARTPVAWGPTAEVLTPETLGRVRRMAEAWDDDAEPCRLSA
ncbi:metal ABC transporter ATP-binding protein [Zavarzinia sp. CC-PAN008]|uniref:metal ABC transporter ATP-binding protein n=1 Tax=Zavarzinia sp. CC-PAN008 TaxID=3243332 RepID=UPI003F742EC8